MPKRIEIDGRFYRYRRGNLVEIPSEWLGKTTHKRTINKRASKQTRKQRMNWGLERAAYRDSDDVGFQPTSMHPRHRAPRHGGDG